MNDKIRITTGEYKIEPNARQFLNSPQKTALNELENIDIDSLPEKSKNQINAAKNKIANEEYQSVINEPNFYQLEKYQRSLLRITFNPNVITKRNLLTDKQLTYADIDKCFDMVQADLNEKGIIVDLKAAPIKRKDYAFDIQTPFEYSKIMPIFSLINPTKTEIRYCTKRFEKGTLYIGNKQKVISIYDKMKEINHKAKKTKSELMLENLIRFEYRVNEENKLKRTPWVFYNEESYNLERAAAKNLILRTIFHNEEKTKLLNKFNGLDILAALIKTEKTSVIYKEIAVQYLANELENIDMNLLQYLNVSSYDSSNYQKVNRLNKELKAVKPIKSNLIDIYNELHELFKRVS